MSTASKTNINGVPTKPIEAQGITAAPRGEAIPRFTKMALESTDFVAKLKPIQPIVFFASSTDERGNVVIDTFIDFGYFHGSGVRIRQRPGRVRTSDGGGDAIIHRFAVNGYTFDAVGSQRKANNTFCGCVGLYNKCFFSVLTMILKFDILYL